MMVAWDRVFDSEASIDFSLFFYAHVFILCSFFSEFQNRGPTGCWRNVFVVRYRLWEKWVEHSNESFQIIWHVLLIEKNKNVDNISNTLVKVELLRKNLLKFKFIQ